MVVDCTVADELDLRDTWNGLQVRVKDGFFLRACFVIAMSVALTGGIESLVYVAQRSVV